MPFNRHFFFQSQTVLFKRNLAFSKKLAFTSSDISSTKNYRMTEQKDIEYGQGYYKKTKLPKVILKTSDLDAALIERKYYNKLMMEAKARGQGYKIDKLRRNIEMDEYDTLHLEEREALLRDISS